MAAPRTALLLALRGRRPVVALALASVLCSVTASAQPSPRDTVGVLRRVIAVSFRGVSIGEALMVLRHTHEVPLAWSGDVVPVDRRVTLTATTMSVANVLERVLEGSGLSFVLTPSGTVVVTPKAPAAPHLADAPSARIDTMPLPDVAHSLRATGVQQLDQVVVMGSTVNGGPEREQPTAMRVVDRRRLAEVQAPRLTDVIRVTLPGLVLWDRGPTGPPPAFAAVRGLASFTTRAIKTYVDGIELASPELFTLQDGRSIDQIEMIRGPQGAALYGPDALNGILQIRTRHGQIGRRSFAPRWHVGGGGYQRDDLPSTQPLYDFAAGLAASTTHASMDLSASLAGAGRDSATREMRSWNVQSGATAILGPLLIEASARLASYEFAASQVAAAARSPEIPQHVREQAVALTVTQQVSERWKHALIAGGHAIRGDREPFRSPLLPPRLPAGASFERAERWSVRYANTVAFTPAIELSTGAEYSKRVASRERVRSTLMFDLSSLYDDAMQSTGAFAQLRIRPRSRLTLSGGTRVERLSSVGPRQGAVWASTAGASWAHAVGGHTIRWRTAWGRGIRPPEPGMQAARSTGALRQLPNPDLAPERQQGIEVGADLFTMHGASLKVTWYTQSATDLFQQVARRNPGATVDAYQFQNVGVISNRGFELDGEFHRARIGGGFSLHVPTSRVQSLSRTYTGELRPGDAMIEVPEASGAAFVRVHQAASAGAPRWTAEVGATVLGPWTGYDWQLLARIERGEATRRDRLRDYWMRYDGIVRPYVAAFFRVSERHQVSLRVDNPANTPALVRDNVTAPLGRVVSLGLSRRE